MEKSKILILIDGMNFVFRSVFTGQGLKAKGKPIHIVYGFLKNYLSLLKNIRNDYPDSECVAVVCWDTGYDKRTEISEKAVRDGIIDKTYKEVRREKKELFTDEEKAIHEDMLEQIDLLNGILKNTNIRQVSVPGNEADDIIATYAKTYKDQYNYIICVTSDKDYYQLLRDNVIIYNAMKKSYYKIDDFRKDFGFEPELWVDCGAFVGDSGDTIIGCHGFGESKTIPYVQKYGGIDNIYAEFKKIVQPLREKYPDIEKISENVLEKYPELITVCCSGIRIGLADGIIKKLPFPKIILNALETEEKVRIAYRLKKMYDDLEIPGIGIGATDETLVASLFREYNFFTLFNAAHEFVDKEYNSAVIRKILKTGVAVEDKNIYICKQCGKTFMSSVIMEKCLDCGEQVDEQRTIQPVQQIQPAQPIQLMLF